MTGSDKSPKDSPVHKPCAAEQRRRHESALLINQGGVDQPGGLINTKGDPRVGGTVDLPGGFSNEKKCDARVSQWAALRPVPRAEKTKYNLSRSLPVVPCLTPPARLPAMNFGKSLWIAALVFALPFLANAADPSLAKNLERVRAVGPKGEGHREAGQAAKALSQADGAELPVILGAMDGASILAENWLRGIAEAIAQKQTASGGKLPVAQLEKFLAETKHSPHARRLAYELIASADNSAESRLIPKLIDDPSLELRRDAVALALVDAAKVSGKEAAVAAYQKAFHAARDNDQIKQAADKLKELGATVDLPLHYGFVMTWQIIGPFDNVEDKGWNIAYPPEEKVDLAAKYEGQKGEVRWFQTTTKDEYGIVDLAKVLDKHKGAVAYAYTEFIAEKEQNVDLRLGCTNANKIWLNGEELTANHVYHAGQEIDQYIGSGKLKKGKNGILLKICQNEQTEAWAQNWQFQLRVCDKIGTAVLSQDRPLAKTAFLLRARR